MRAIVGFVAINAWLVTIGLALAGALGLRSRRVSPEAENAVGRWREVLVALGPGLLLGLSATVPWLILCLVIGIPVTPLAVVVIGVLLIAGSRAVEHRNRAGRVPGMGMIGRPRLRLAEIVAAVLVLYAAVGAYTFAKAPTRGDDARIWSLRGLTLIYFHRLQPEIFLSPGQSGGHPVYPLLQPLVETIVAEAMGSPQLQIYHSELWLIAVAAIWSAAWLLARRSGAPDWRRPYWLAPLGLIALTPILIWDVYVGDADVTGAVLFGAAIACFALWVELGSGGCLAAGALLLAAAASTKDEESLGVIPVLLVVILASAVWRRRTGATAPLDGEGRSGSLWAAVRSVSAPLLAVVYVVCAILPWRLWLSAHNLTDSVEPKLPEALSPVWLYHRGTINEVAPAMLQQVLQRWSWLAAIFLVTCGACLLTRTAVRLTLFYVGCIAGTVVMLVWLYVATPLPLESFLIPTSMDRTVGMFMIPAGIGAAHLLSALLVERSAARPSESAEPAAQAAIVG